MLNRAYRYRLYPTPEQEKLLLEYANAARFIFNLCLEQRRDWWRQAKASGTDINLATQSREVTELRAEHEWLRAVPRHVHDYALKDVDRAFRLFYRGGGFPRFRTKERHVAFRVKGVDTRWDRVNRKWATVRLPKAPDIKFRCTRDVVGTIKDASVQWQCGRWFVSFSTESEAVHAQSVGAVGIDRGVANTLTMSSGESLSLPTTVQEQVAARKRAQRVLSRRVKGSRRRTAQRVITARYAARVAAARCHWLHEQSTAIANRYGVVAIEALNTANMTRAGRGKRGLNRSILEQGWATFAAMLEYKLAARGGQLHLVDPAYTSQTCSACGSVAKESRKSQASFECVDCGHAAHADVNAAINILRRSPAGVEGSGYGPVEAQSGTMLTHLENLAA